MLKMCELVARGGIEQHLHDIDITGLQYTILSTVSRGQKYSVAELARACRVTPQSMSDLVVTLEQKGLISREVDPLHRRIQRISITDEGVATLTACDHRMDVLEKNLFNCLSEKELNNLRTYLEKIVADADAAINFARPSA